MLVRIRNGDSDPAISLFWYNFSTWTHQNITNIVSCEGKRTHVKKFGASWRIFGFKVLYMRFTETVSVLLLFEPVEVQFCSQISKEVSSTSPSQLKMPLEKKRSISLYFTALEGSGRNHIPTSCQKCAWIKQKYVLVFLKRAYGRRSTHCTYELRIHERKHPLLFKTRPLFLVEVNISPLSFIKMHSLKFVC